MRLTASSRSASLALSGGSSRTVSGPVALSTSRCSVRARGIGLMLAFATADGPGLVLRALNEQRLVLNATGPDTVRLLPPLNVSEADIDEAVARIAALHE